MSIRYHKNGLASSHQTVGRWFIYVLCYKNILTKLVGYQQPFLSLCQDGIRGWNHFSFMWIVFTF